MLSDIEKLFNAEALFNIGNPQMVSIEGLKLDHSQF